MTIFSSSSSSALPLLSISSLLAVPLPAATAHVVVEVGRPSWFSSNDGDYSSSSSSSDDDDYDRDGPSPAQPAPAPPSSPPLPPPRYQPLPLGSIRPLGWMRSQLRAQSDGLSGKGWLGVGLRANRTLWTSLYDNTTDEKDDGLNEAYPYWINGAFPLAVLTEDVDLLGYIQRGLDVVFAKAEDESRGGWLGPTTGGPSSSFRFCTALTLYVDYYSSLSDAAAADDDDDDDDYVETNRNRADRAVDALWDHASALLRLLKSPGGALRPGSWEHSRWEELMESYAWLLSSRHASEEAAEERRADVYDLLEVAREQGFDWVRWFDSDEDRPFIHPSSSLSSPPVSADADDADDNDADDDDVIRPWFPNNTRDSDLIGANRWLPTVDRQWTHGVNVAQALQTWHLLSRLSPTPEEAADWIVKGREGWDRIYDLHGQVTGVISGDENLAGRPPQRGTETCAVVETLNSAMNAFAISGEVMYLDRAERIAYNALPGAFYNGTMWSLNYYQQVNKVDAISFYPPDRCEDVKCQYCYGLPFECCVSNHGQGWPKFVMRQMMQTTRGDGEGRHRLVLTQYFPSEMTRPVALGTGATVESVQIETDYPFDETVTIHIAGASDTFVLELRIPEWCTGASISVVDGRREEEEDSSQTKTADEEDGKDEEAVVMNAKNGTMHPVPIPPGDHVVVLTLPMRIRIERRPPYIPSMGTVINADAAAVVRGPIVYALPRDYVRDVGPVFDDDDDDDLQPPGQPHAQQNYLLGIGEWRYALIVGSDNDPGKDLAYVPRERKVFPPEGQGPFAQSLVPGTIVGRAVVLTEEEWDVVQKGRGAADACTNGTTSIGGYESGWADVPPHSPVGDGGRRRASVLVELYPYGATDLRIAEFPTATAAAADTTAAAMMKLDVNGEEEEEEK